jgi:hypothetical protein
MGSVYKIFGDFRMPAEYAMKLSRACFSTDECTVILVRLQNLHQSKLKYLNVVVNIESVWKYLYYFRMLVECAVRQTK